MSPGHFRTSVNSLSLRKIQKTFRVSGSAKLLFRLRLHTVREASSTSNETKLSLETESHYQGADIIREANST